MSEYLHLAIEDASNTPIAAADAAILAVIEAKDPAAIYGEDLITALARAGSIKQHEAKRRLSAAYPKDMAVREWWARIRGAEEDLRSQEPSEKYITTNEGGIKANVANAITMLRKLPLAFDEFACRAKLTGSLPWRPTEDSAFWGDNDDIKAAEWCQHQRLDVNSALAAEGAMCVARDRGIHPVRDYLQSLTWDGEPRLNTWLSTYMGCEDTSYVRSVASKWMISAVNRVMVPGCQADYTLVLEGLQGVRKSSALRVLGGEWFSDDLENIGTKDSAMQLQGRWIVEIAELDAFRRAEMTTIKAWLVRRIDNFRPPYGRRTAEFNRQNVFCASTNKSDWGQDDTGLRRFWPVRVVSTIDIDGLKRDRHQLWAEAKFRFDEGEKSYLAGDVEVEATKQQAARQDQDPWVDKVLEWARVPVGTGTLTGVNSNAQRVYLSEILLHCLGAPAKDWNHGHKARVSRILRLNGYILRQPLGEGEYWEPPARAGGEWG